MLSIDMRSAVMLSVVEPICPAGTLVCFKQHRIKNTLSVIMLNAILVSVVSPRWHSPIYAKKRDSLPLWSNFWCHP